MAAELPAGVIQGPQWHPRLPLAGFQPQLCAAARGASSAGRRRTLALQAWSGREAERRGRGVRCPNTPRCAGRALTAWRSVACTSHRPPQFKGPRPVLISIHGGPSSQARPTHLSGSLRYLVETLGMHLILPNVRGSEGFGQRFLKLDNGRQREDAVRDISALLDLIAARPEMDARRVIVSGGSYGGYMSLAVATRESARIAGSICRVGIANFVSFSREHRELSARQPPRRVRRRARPGYARFSAAHLALEPSGGGAQAAVHHPRPQRSALCPTARPRRWWRRCGRPAPRSGS